MSINNHFKLIILLVILGIFRNLYGLEISKYEKDGEMNGNGFYSKKPGGFLWYGKLLEKELELDKTLEEKINKAPLTNLEEAKLRNEKLKQKLEDAIAIMLDSPTIENAILAQKAQKLVFDRSESVSEAWLIAALMDAGLVSKEMNPNILHRRISKEEKEKQYINELQEIAKDWGLFFYVMPNCKYCEQFTPIILELSQETGFQVLAISEYGMDYGGFKGQKNNGFLDQLNPEKLAPVLFLVNKDGKTLYPIARGLTDISKLKENILNMIKIDNERKDKLRGER